MFANAKKAHADLSILQGFVLCLKRNHPQLLKIRSCNKFIHKCVFPSMILFHVIA